MVKSKTTIPNPHEKIGTHRFDDQPDRFWALKDVSFEIEQGDRVGIIGRNGAGKSTLLKILSRITEPTEGKISIRGRVASLLEVGTGFHQELTGRDNIYLSGAIRGMKKREIDKKIDEIIDFSEIEKFIDTPVKRYSSGMFVRLGFAVAAFLDSEILLADEVLAVGDQEFQKKCLGKMEDVSRNEGRTVLFVSHNMTNIVDLCNNGILLDNGRMISMCNVNQVIEKYNKYGKKAGFFFNSVEKPASFEEIWFEDCSGNSMLEIVNGEPYCICFSIKSKLDHELEIRIYSNDQLMRPLWSFSNRMYGLPGFIVEDRRVVKVKIEGQTITTDEVNIDLLLRDRFSSYEYDSVSNISIAVVQPATSVIARYSTWPVLIKATVLPQTPSLQS